MALLPRGQSPPPTTPRGSLRLGFRMRFVTQLVKLIARVHEAKYHSTGTRSEVPVTKHIRRPERKIQGGLGVTPKELSIVVNLYENDFALIHRGIELAS
jgi:hypothetical protein